MLQRALDRGVERVEPVERTRLGRAEAPAGRGLRAVVGEDAVRELEPAIVGQVAGALVEDPLPERDVAEQPAVLGEPELRAVGELAGLAEVVDERGGEQQVWIQTRVQLSAL